MKAKIADFIYFYVRNVVYLQELTIHILCGLNISIKYLNNG